MFTVHFRTQIQEIRMQNTEIPPYRYIDDDDIKAVFKYARPGVERWIKREYHKHKTISRGVAIDRQQVIIIAEKLLLKINEYHIDPQDLIKWIDEIAASEPTPINQEAESIKL